MILPSLLSAAFLLANEFLHFSNRMTWSCVAKVTFLLSFLLTPVEFADLPRLKMTRVKSARCWSHTRSDGVIDPLVREDDFWLHPD